MSKLQEEFDQFIQGKHPGLKFRPQQKEAILDIIAAYEEDPNGVYLLDAPTGSGKSVIAMIFADFLTFKGNRGYILASDYRDWETDRKSTRQKSSHITRSRMPSSA